MFNALVFAIKFAIPHFATDIACCYKHDNGDMVAMFPVEEYDDTCEVPDGITTVRYFTWLGMMFFAKQSSAVISYEEYLKIVDKVDGKS